MANRTAAMLVGTTNIMLLLFGNKSFGSTQGLNYKHYYFSNISLSLSLATAVYRAAVRCVYTDNKYKGRERERRRRE
jgi:hypothetical protein